MLTDTAPPARGRGRLLLGLGMLLVAAVGAGYPLYWSHRSNASGAVLLTKGLSAITETAAASCSNNPTTALTPHAGAPGVLEIPSLGLTAPVVDGLSDAVLNVAVGHDPAAPWPGNAGESVLEAHDVSYFAALNRISSGAVVNWVTPCATATFTVIGTAVRSPGDFIATPAGGAGLVLITCYPTNALFWTTHRWVVTTRLVKTTYAAQSLPRTTPSGPTLSVPAPPSLVAQNLTLQANEGLIHLNTLSIAGAPSAAWKQGPGPMKVEADALAVYFGAYKAIEAGNQAWWQAIAPGVAMPRSWPGFSSVNVTITMAGTTPTSIAFTSSTAVMHVGVSNLALHLTSLS